MEAKPSSSDSEQFLLLTLEELILRSFADSSKPPDHGIAQEAARKISLFLKEKLGYVNWDK